MTASISRLLVSCPDEPGLVARISQTIFDHGGNVVENGEFVEPGNNFFYMRTSMTGVEDRAALRGALAAVLPEEAEVRLFSSRRKRMLLMATKEPHCLGDLLIRCQFGDLNAEVCSVIANHDTLRGLVGGFSIPYHLVSHEDYASRQAHEHAVRALIEEERPDLIVMAKYMRILTPEFTEAYAGRLINIHHSFLPAFIGANPYKQAWRRGVKIIGATAHYATADLDEGPIIAQDVVNVNHTHGPADMARSGRDVEKRVLARAVRYALEDRVVVTGNKTIVFE